MPLPHDQAAARYTLLRDALIAQAPRAWAHVIELVARVPAQLTLDSVWASGRDKPCWSNIKVAIGARIAQDLTLSPDFASCAAIAGPDWDMQMLARGPSWKKRDNFRMVGPAAVRFMAELAPGGLRSYPWRLYAIRAFAQSLQAGPARDVVQALVAGGPAFGPDGLHAWASRFAQGAGQGWGATTVLHMLTDLGLAIKPDLHVRRSAVRMGLLAPEVPSDLPTPDIDARAAQLDPPIVEAILAMARQVQPLAQPGATSALREVDKVLMEWSLQGLLRPL